MLAHNTTRSPIACMNFAFLILQNTSPAVKRIPLIISILKLSGVIA